MLPYLLRSTRQYSANMVFLIDALSAGAISNYVPTVLPKGSASMRFLCRVFIVFVGTLIGFINDGVAQTPETDSLKSLLLQTPRTQTPRDTIRADVLNELAWELHAKEPDKAIQYAQEAIRIAELYDKNKKVSYSCNIIGLANTTAGRFTTAIDWFSRCVRIREELGEYKGVANALSNMGEAYIAIGNYTLATTVFLRALAIREEANDSLGLGRSWHNIASMYLAQDNDSAALEYAQKAVQMRTAINDVDGLAGSLKIIAFIHKNRSQYAAAGQTLAQAAQVASSARDTITLAEILTVAGEVALAQDSLDAAMLYLQQAATYFRRFDDKRDLISVDNTIGKVLLRQAQPSSALQYFRRSIAYGRELNVRPALLESYHLLSRTFGDIKQFDSAYYYSMQASMLGDSLRTEQNAIAKLQRQFEKQKQEQDLRNVNDSRQKLLRWSIVSGVAALLVVIGLLANRQRLQRRDSQTLAAQNTEIQHQQSLLAERAMILEQEQQRTSLLLQETEMLRQCSEQEKQYLSSAVERILATMTTVAQGTLSVELAVSSDDDIGRLSAGINRTVRNMREAIAQVSETSFLVNQSTSDIATVARNLLQLAQVQQLQMTIIADSVNETTQAITQGARHVEVAQQSVADEQRIASDAVSVVEQLIERFSTVNVLMENFALMIQTLSASSDKVGGFVSEIKSVADKTNLLALNAAIEAARAGDHGRGFAVVAQEVQDLAEHSNQATKKIAEVIRTIQNDITKTSEAMKTTTAAVEQGLSYADKTANALAAIVSGSQKSMNSMNNVSVASEQQMCAGNTITQNVNDLKSAAYETITGIQSIAEAANNLYEFSSHLEEQMKKFRL